MSIWIRALCTKSVASLTPEGLRAGIVDRLPVLAAYYGEADPEAALARIRVEGDAAGPWRLHYREDEERFVRIERWADAARVREKVGELRQSLDACDEDEVDDVRAFLGDVVETVALELNASDCEGIGWPVAIAAAAHVAALGEGLVQADGEGWMKPEGREVAQILDAD